MLMTETVDYNSWQESEEGRKLTAGLDKDIVLAEGRSCMRSKHVTDH